MGCKLEKLKTVTIHTVQSVLIYTRCAALRRGFDSNWRQKTEIYNKSSEYSQCRLRFCQPVRNTYTKLENVTYVTLLTNRTSILPTFVSLWERRYLRYDLFYHCIVYVVKCEPITVSSSKYISHNVLMSLYCLSSGEYLQDKKLFKLTASRNEIPTFITASEVPIHYICKTYCWVQKISAV